MLQAKIDYPKQPTWNIRFPPDMLLSLPLWNYVLFFIRVHTIGRIGEEGFIGDYIFPTFLVEFGTLVDWWFITVIIISQSVKSRTDKVWWTSWLMYHDHWGTRVLIVLKNQKCRVKKYCLCSITVTSTLKLNHTKTCMYAWKSFSCGDLVRVNSSVILIHFILKEKTK